MYRSVVSSIEQNYARAEEPIHCRKSDDKPQPALFRVEDEMSGPRRISEKYRGGDEEDDDEELDFRDGIFSSRSLLVLPDC